MNDANPHIQINLTEDSLRRFCNLVGLGSIPSPSELSQEQFDQALLLLEAKVAGNLNLDSTSLFLAPMEAEPFLEPEPVFIEPSSKALSILMIDELGSMVYNFKQGVKRLGYQVQSARSSVEALDHFMAKDFDVVILDIMLPTEKEGLALLTQLKQLSRVCDLTSQLVVLSPKRPTEFKNQVLHQGADCYIEMEFNWFNRMLLNIQDHQAGLNKQL